MAHRRLGLTKRTQIETAGLAGQSSLMVLGAALVFDKGRLYGRNTTTR
jgi:hypothetical protein